MWESEKGVKDRVLGENFRMEENDHSNRDAERQDSGDESNRAILPLLQAPANLLPHRITNFFIDNILRPDFGRRKEGTLNRESGIRRGRENHSSAFRLGQVEGTVAEEGTSSPSSINGAKKASISEEAPLKPREESGDQCLSSDSDSSQTNNSPSQSMLWPAWVYCTRYSDRPSSGERKLFIFEKSSSVLVTSCLDVTPKYQSDW